MVISIISWVIPILYLGECVVTDKEYARLPPVFEQDNFERCMLLEDEALYCSIEFHLKPIDAENPSPTWQIIQELNTDPKNYHHDNLRHGICIPLSCPNISTSYEDPRFKGDLADCYSKKYEKDGLYGTIGYMHCQTSEAVPFDIYDYLVTIFLATYIIFIIYASLYEGIASYKSKEEYEKITETNYGKVLSCFSVSRNWIRLKTVNWTPELKALKGIQGVRVYSMFLVITCHATMMAAIGPVGNTKFIENYPDHPMAIILASGPYGVEGFFLISSWMLSYNIFKHFDKQNGRKFDLKTMTKIFVVRYLRLTPPLALMIILHSTLFYHASAGPWWDLQIGRDKISCRQNGWTNLLYINNIVNPSQMCLIETWYMAVDMHGFFLVLGILYFTVKKPKRLWWLVPSVWLLMQTIHLKRLYDNEIYEFMVPTAENLYFLNGLLHGKSWILTLASTWGNMTGTLVGMVAGYVYYKYEYVEIIPKKIHSVLFWMIIPTCLGIVVLPGMWILSKNYYPSWWFSLPYFFLSTTVFGIGIAAALINFSKGIGSIAKWSVEWEPLYILGRLSYSSYLVHYAVALLQAGSSKSLPNPNVLDILFDTLKMITASFIFALILTMTVEMPVTALLSTFMKKNLELQSRKAENCNDENDETKQRVKHS